MTINAKATLDRARRIIQDEQSVRWPLDELRLWLNDALREIALYKPTAFSSSFIFVLQAGTYQVIPSTYASVIRIPRNLKVVEDSPRLGGAAIRTVDGDLLTAQNRNWHDTQKTAPNKTVRNVVYDASDPLAFWVYPPNDGNGIVEIIASKVPVGIDAPTSPDSLDSYDINIDVQDIYGNAIVDYVLYRSYAKDSQFAGSMNRATAYYQAFMNALGVNIQNAAALNPNAMSTTDNRA